MREGIIYSFDVEFTLNSVIRRPGRADFMAKWFRLVWQRLFEPSWTGVSQADSGRTAKSP